MDGIFVGVDCGATNLRVGVFDKEGNLLASSKTASPLKSQPGSFAAKVKELLVSGANPVHIGEITGIGVGTPGPLDLEKGLLLPSSNIGNTEPINLKSQFEIDFNGKVYFDRDTNLALLGEVWQGAAVGVRNVVMLTLGSGVGGAIMADGEIERGEGGKAGEIGHMIIQIQNSKIKDQKLPVCGLGHQGCLEAWINSAKDLDELGIYLGYGLASIVDIFNPEKIVIGGGKLYKGDFLPKAIEIMKQLGMKPAVDEVQVLYAKLGEWSGVYGGAKLASQVTKD